MPRFDEDYDKHKSARNKQTHGIDFLEARELWNDRDRIEIPARTHGDEPRSLVIGRIGQHLWTAVITYRHEQDIRIISCRHPHDNEAAIYAGRDRP
jgi:uncharacterized DUF497 family protein